MLRLFDFEEQTYCTPDCIPLAVRRKLDRAGLKIGLAHWRAMGQGERLALCHLPAEQPDEIDALRQFLCEAVKRISGEEPKELPLPMRAVAEPPHQVPAPLVEAAAREGVALTQQMWEGLDGDQRYALMKLGLGPRARHSLHPALQEFFGAH